MSPLPIGDSRLTPVLLFRKPRHSEPAFTFLAMVMVLSSKAFALAEYSPSELTLLGPIDRSLPRVLRQISIFPFHLKEGTVPYSNRLDEEVVIPELNLAHFASRTRSVPSGILQTSVVSEPAR